MMMMMMMMMTTTTMIMMLNTQCQASMGPLLEQTVKTAGAGTNIQN